MAKQLKITWKKSQICTKHKLHRPTIKALGLRRINHSVVQTDTPQLRGMLRLVDFMVSVEEVK